MIFGISLILCISIGAIVEFVIAPKIADILMKISKK